MLHLKTSLPEIVGKIFYDIELCLLSAFAGDCRILSAIAGVSWREPEIVGVCRSFPTFARDCRGLPEISTRYFMI